LASNSNIRFEFVSSCIGIWIFFIDTAVRDGRYDFVRFDAILLEMSLEWFRSPAPDRLPSCFESPLRAEVGPQIDHPVAAPLDRGSTNLIELEPMSSAQTHLAARKKAAGWRFTFFRSSNIFTV